MGEAELCDLVPTEVWMTHVSPRGPDAQLHQASAGPGKRSADRRGCGGVRARRLPEGKLLCWRYKL